jgi:hypothetical protein
LGKCGKNDVFAEMNANDAGVTEYFTDGQLVGATDTLTPDCTQYGTVPTCSPTLSWTKLDAGAKPQDDEEDDERPSLKK